MIRRPEPPDPDDESQDDAGLRDLRETIATWVVTTWAWVLSHLPRRRKRHQPKHALIPQAQPRSWMPWRRP